MSGNFYTFPWNAELIFVPKKISMKQLNERDETNHKSITGSNKYLIYLIEFKD